MKKLLTFLTLLTLFFTTAWADEVSFSMGNTLTYTTNYGGSSGGSGGTVLITSTSNPSFTVSSDHGYVDGSNHVRIYSGGQLTISISTGTITKVEINSTAQNNSNNGPGKLSLPDGAVGSYSYSGYMGTWTSETGVNSVTLNATAQFRFSAVYVTYTTGDSPTTYSLTLPTGLPGGTVTATGADDLTAIPAGTEMTVTATANTGYQFYSWTAPTNVTDWDEDGNTATFTMPASDVTVGATFVENHPTLRLAGRFNGRSTSNWITDSSGPEFTYDVTNEQYTIDAYFTGESKDQDSDVDFFYLRSDNSDLKANADGNCWVAANGGTYPLGGSSNFRIYPGVYTITVNKARTSITFTKITPSLTLSPNGGDVEAGQVVTATSNLQSLIDDIKNAYDKGATGTVSLQVSTDQNSWSDNISLNNVGNPKVYGRAVLGNIYVTGDATFNVVAANNSKTYRRTNTLNVGKKYIIVNEGAGVGFKTGGYEETITISDHQTTLSDGSTVIEFKLGGEEGAYTFMNGSKYLQHSSGNVVNVASDDAKTWDVTIDNSTYAATMKATDNYFIRYNSGASGNKFRAYASNTTGAAVQLYEQMVEETKDFTITYAEVTGGSASGATAANEGETINVTVIADDGYACTGITVTGVNASDITNNGDGTYTFTMPASNVTVTPSFAAAYAITYVAEPAAGGTVTGVASAVYDARVEVTVTSNADYQLSGTPTYTYNGITQQLAGAGTAENPYYFNMPGYATTVTATFTKLPHGISVTSAHGEVTGIPETATSGTEVTFTVTPNAGYVVSSVSGTFNNGNSSLNITDNGDDTYTFSMPAYDVAITVTYFASEDYELLTDLADINEEDTYLIVGGPKSGANAGDKTYVMGTAGSGQANGVALTQSNYDSTTGIITSTADMAIVNFVINNGNYALHTAKGYLNNTSGSNNLSYSSTPAYATITMGEEGLVDIELVDNSSKGYLSFNTSGSMWKFYGSSQGANYIFKLANKNKVKRPTITGAAGEFLGQYNFIGKDNVSMACTTEDAVIEYSLDGGTTWLTYSEVFEITTNAAGNTVEVQARATKTDMEPSDVVTATFTCIKPTAPTFGNNEAGAYVNPVFVYPKSALNDRRAYGEESVSFCYTTNGTDADASSPAVATSNSNGYYIVLDDDATLSVVTVINGIASDPAGGAYTFSVDAPAFSLAGGSYDGNQQTRLSTNTKTQQNNLSWNTVIYYTTGNTEFEFNATTGEVTSEGWIAYDPTNSPYIDILAANGTTTIKAVTLSNYFNGQSEYRASDVTTETYVLTAANLSITISPAAGTYVNAQNVTLGVKNNIGDYIIYYTTDGSDPNTNGTEYTGTPITVDHDMTIKVYAVDSRTGDGGTATAEAVYKIGIQPVVYSPFPGTIYKGDNEDINVEMFSVTPNAKIYYTVAEGEGNYPDDPTTNSTLYSEPIPLETGKVYNFKAIAVVGSLVSTVTPGKFTVQAKGNGWLNVKEMNEDDNYTYADQLDNPVQVVYMSTWRNNGTKPEFCFVRDNSGYGLVYFGGSGVSSYNDYTKFQMGDWLAGGTVKGKLNVWSSSFINELGTSSGSITDWPDSSLGNTAILPEETTNKAITDGWTYDGAYTGSDYEDYIDPDKNLFGHYVHMRKNNITNVTGAGGGDEKHIGIITDQSGVPLNYYDGFYLFSGYNNNKDYDQTFFDNIQNNGGTFDVYAIVYFYGPNANNSSYSNAPYEIFPIDFEWIYKPLFNIETGTYYEPQTISLTCETEGAQIWYKTSEMEAFELYTGPFEVDATTTIESYSTLPSKYNDVLESVINSITVTIGTVEAPVITEQSVVKTVGESVTTDITCTTEGATIYYTTDGSDPKTSETRIEYTLGQQLTFDETTTVRAIAMQDGYYSVEAESRTYTFVKSNGIEYTLVTNVNQLNENSVYVIVNKANNMAMSTNQKTNNRGAAGVMFKNADKTIVYGNDDLAQFTLKKTGNNWYIQTNNSNENGYLSVGNGNTLLTSATADGNAEATITIDGTNTDVDKTNEAHISFIYNNETTRYLRYWNRDHLFNTYTTETNAPVFLYYIKATPLATIEKEGTTTEGQNQYTIADELVAVYMSEDMLWCKDQGNVSIAKIENTNEYEDYMNNHAGLQEPREWDQSNWVALKFTGATPEQREIINGYVGKFIAPATVTGYYIDDFNYVIEVPILDGQENIFSVTNGGSYPKNLYCAANFLPENLDEDGAVGHSEHTADRHYFFVNPKIQEVCEVTFAMWHAVDDNNGYFVLPEANGTQNDSRIYGAFNVNWRFNNNGNLATTLKNMPNVAFKFTAVVQRTEPTQSDAPVIKADPVGMDGVTPDGNYIVYPMDLDPTNENNIVTRIENVVIGNGEVKSVKYVNVAGIVSDRPFQGVNIVVTEYTDGSRTTSKMLKK